MSHDYVSTACLHEGEDPALHGSCRKTCKFCDAPCQCPRHAPGEGQAPAEGWVDQSRSVARELLDMARTAEALHGLSAFERRLRDDPRLFWLRGEERPPGEWRST